MLTLHRRARTALPLAAFLALLSLAALARSAEQDLDDTAGLDQDLKKAATRGAFTIRLVGPDGRSIEDARFLRFAAGLVTIADFPRAFSLEGQPLFTSGSGGAAGLRPAGGVAVFCDAESSAAGETAYRASCTADIPPGRHAIQPFGLAFGVGARLSAEHPAISADGRTLNIRTTAVTFRAVDKATGRGCPLPQIKVLYEGRDLLSGLVELDQPWRFFKVTLYLPWGVSYVSAAGRFSVDRQGRVEAADLAEGVTLADGTFTFAVEAEREPPEAPAGGLWIVAHGLRRVFARGEKAPFMVIASGTYPAADHPVVLRSGERSWKVGTVAFPSVSGVDSRLVLVDTGLLGPGGYRLGLEHPDSRDWTFEVAEHELETPVFLHTVACCNEADFTTTPEGLQALADAHIRSFTYFGFYSLLNRPGVTAERPAPAVPSGAPSEMRAPGQWKVALLDDMLRKGVGTIDYQVGRAGFYNEGLSFHHSYAPSVDRVVRRTQIFAQEYDDHPAFRGFSYTWFPVLQGYNEGGVPTDPLYGKRMEALAEIVRRETGLSEPPRDRVRPLIQGKARDDALLDQYRRWWRAEQHWGWYKTFELYNRKLREVNPGLVCTTSENAGHDGGKSLREIGGAHNAMSFETYTDFGDWPMSSGWTVDWYHGCLPGKPVWLTVEGNHSDASRLTKVLYAFARGAEGIGIPMREPSAARENRLRGLMADFVRRYGPISDAMQRDPSVAVMVNELAPRGLYDAHALHSHLTRLGYAPVVLSEVTVEEGGVPAGTKVVLLPNLRIPFSQTCLRRLADFMAAGGRVVAVGEGTVEVPGARTLAVPLKQIWDLGGFTARVAFWQEFRKVAGPLSDLMAQLGLAPRNGADPEKALVLPIRSGGLDYVAVISSPLDYPDTEFHAVRGVQVAVGAPAAVWNLVTGRPVSVHEGKVAIDLVSEPAALLALLPAKPDRLLLACPEAVIAGQAAAAAAKPAAAGGALPFALPVEYVFRDPAGRVRRTVYALSGGSGASCRTAETDGAGTWRVTATDLVTGLRAEAAIGVRAADGLPAARAAPDVFLPHPDRIVPFLSAKGTVRVILEDEQAGLLPQAARLVDLLKAGGRAAELQRVSDESYDTLWLRWMPTAQDERVLERIDRGEIVGWRGHMKPYIDKRQRAHVPEKGGWTDIDPPFVIRTDCVVFSGGRIASSLRSVSGWMGSANWPGRGQAVLDVVLSPFWGGRDALAIVARDPEGAARAVDRLADCLRGSVERERPPEKPPLQAALASVAGSERVPLATPLLGFVPPAKVSGLFASRDGYAAVLAQGRSVIVAPDGTVKGALGAPDEPLGLAIARGGWWFQGDLDVRARHGSWRHVTAWGAAMTVFDAAAGRLSRFPLPGDYERESGVMPEWEFGYAPSPDGRMFFGGLLGGGFILADLESRTWRVSREPAAGVRFCERVREPAYATAAAFSPDGRYVVYTTANRPRGYGGMGAPPAGPFCTTLRLVDVAAGRELWRRDGREMRDPAFSAYNGCLAVSADASRIAFIDYEQHAVLYDRSGKEVSRKAIPGVTFSPKGNPKPLKTEIADDGATVLFAAAETILVTDGDGKPVSTATVPELADVSLAPDGSVFHAANVDGAVILYTRAGAETRRLNTAGLQPRVRALADGVLVAEGAGNLIRLDGAGRTVWKTAVTDQAPAAAAPEPVRFQGPALYAEPETLAVLQRRAGAKEAARWQPSGEGESLFGRRFHPVTAPVQVSAGGKGPFVVRFVYRHAGKGPTVSVSSGRTARSFILDLPTPEYRVVDLPAEGGEGVAVTVAPCEGLSVAELSVHVFKWPGANAAYVRPAGARIGGDEAGPDLEGPGDGLDLPADDITGSAASRAHGKMKNCAIFATNTDVDRVAGPYFRETGNPLKTFDGARFGDLQPTYWTAARPNRFASFMGSRMLLALGYQAQPRLCATYSVSLRQSEVMQGIAILRGAPRDFLVDTDPRGPEVLTAEPRVVQAVFDNDQFFNVFDMSGSRMEVLGIYVYGGSRDHGLSEVELYE